MPVDPADLHAVGGGGGDTTLSVHTVLFNVDSAAVGTAAGSEGDGVIDCNKFLRLLIDILLF